MVDTFFNFLRHLHIIFHGDWTKLHSHKSVQLLPFHHPHQHPLSSVFLIMAIIAGVRCYLIVGSTWVSLLTCDVEDLFMCPLTILMSSLENCLFSSSAYSLIGLFFLLLSYMSSLYILNINPLFNIWLAKFFSYSFCFFCCVRAFEFDCSSIYWLLLVLFELMMSCPKHHCQDQYWGLFYTLSSRSFMVSGPLS